MMPQVFEMDRRRPLPTGPHDRHHLAKRAHFPSVSPRTSQQASDQADKTLLVRPAILHEQLKRLLGIQRNVLIPRAELGYVEAGRRQALLKYLQVIRRRDDNRTLAAAQSTRNETLQRVEERIVRIVDLDEMLTGANLSPGDITSPTVKIAIERHGIHAFV